MRSRFGQSLFWMVALALFIAPLSSLKAAEAATKAKADAKAAEVKAEPKTEAKAEPKAEAKAEPKAEPKADAKVEAKGDSSTAAAKTGHHKSPALASLLAVVPGVAVHGAGHMYAGSWMKGLGLLAIEGAAVGIGVATVNHGIDDINKLSDGSKNGAIPTNVGTAYQTLGVAMVCSMAFLWTWFDDMAGSAIAAKEYNRLADEEANQARLQLLPNGDGAALALVSNF